MRLPLDYTRINQFPEWFTVQADAAYQVKLGSTPPEEKKGARLAEGIPFKVKAGETMLIEVSTL